METDALPDLRRLALGGEMTLILQAPNSYAGLPGHKPLVFLAGSIDMGKAEFWQDEVAAALKDCVVLNPRRDDWDNTWVQSIDHPQFKEQVEWELQAMEDADLIVLYLSPGSFSPISLLEFGLFHSKPMIVCCPEGFYRKGNVDIVCRRYDVPQADSLDDLVEKARALLGAK